MAWLPDSTRRRVLLAVLAALALAAVGVAATSMIYAPQSGDVTLNATDGPAVTLSGSADADLEAPAPDANTIVWNTTAGSATFSSTGHTEATVQPGNLEGTYTSISGIDASGASLTITPDDKRPLTVAGSVTDVSFQDADLSDDATALTYSSGGSGTITVTGLAGSTDWTAATPGGSEIDSGTTTAGGDASISVTSASDEDVILFTNHAPTASNLSPPDNSQLTETMQTFTVDVNDTDFPRAMGDEVTARLYVDGVVVGMESVTANETVSIDHEITDGGDTTYHWELTDSYGGTTTTSPRTIFSPSTLYLYKETQNSTGQHELIDNASTNVEVTITGREDSVKQTTVSDGTVNMTGLPPEESYVFTVDADGYYTREIYVASIYDQSALFLLNESNSAVENSLTVTDRTGNFEEPIITVERVTNTTRVNQMPDEGDSWVTMGGDRLGASGAYITNLQQSSRYRFVVINQAGNTRVLGEYTAKADGEIPLEIGSIEYDLEPENTEYSWTTQVSNESGNPSIRFAYDDAGNLTSNVSVEFRYRNNSQLVASQDFTLGPYGEVVYTQPVSADEFNTREFVVEWSAERNGTVISGSRVVGGKRTVRPPLGDVWMEIAYGGGVFVLAFVAGSGIGAPAAAVTVGVFAGLAVFIGLAPPELGFGATILALFLAVTMMVVSGRRV